MKILILSSLPNNSGCHLRAKYLSDALKKAGHKTIFVTPLMPLPFMLDIFISFFWYLFKVFITPFDFGMCIKPYPNTLLPLIIKRFFFNKIKIGVDIDDIDYGYRKGFLSNLLRFIQKPMPMLCDIVTCHNSNLERWIPEEYSVPKDKIYILKQGVDTTIFFKVSDKEQREDRCYWEKRLNISKKDILLVHTAHLNIASDFDDILEAFYIASNITKDLKLLVAGGGPLLEFYKKKAFNKNLQGKIFFTGLIKPEEVRRCINAADFCLVYYKDRPVNLYRTSMKIRENLAMAKRVIANDIGDLKEFQDFIYPAGTGAENYAKGILNAIYTFSDNREIRGSIYIKEKYDWDKIGFLFSERLKNLF